MDVIRPTVAPIAGAVGTPVDMLRVGLQLVAAPGGEARLIALASALGLLAYEEDAHP
jgi:hypothetical protein